MRDFHAKSDRGVGGSFKKKKEYREGRDWCLQRCREGEEQTAFFFSKSKARDSSHNTNQFTPARDIDYSWFIPHMVAADIKQTLSNL